ncbi:MAG: ABC transporter substrate-binding protein [Fibromonadaceae bacterium]|jgi:iron complex transport system substrate-binding protein|nr:ABC transporter substrate-binding protein [Fibromonadaceae bacterium]
MNKRLKFLLLFFLLFFLASCAKEPTLNVASERAEHFSLDYFDGYKILSIREAWNGDLEKHRWLLLDSAFKEHELHDSLKKMPIIHIPVKNVVILSTTAIAFMERLDLLDKIIAIENRNLIYSEKMQNLIDSLSIKQVGSGNKLDLETILILKPALVLTFGTGSSLYDDYPRFKTAEIPAVLTAEWMESHPLARFEWIRFFGVLFGKEREADSIFAETQKRYDSLVQLALNAAKKPLVLTGYPQGAEWLAGGGGSYFARFLQDAKAKYIWESNTQSGTLTLGIETALQSGGQAEFWLHPSLWTSKAEILQHEPRISMLPLWQSGRIYQSSKRVGKNGSRDFYESAVANPDLVLADLISIFHPEILPEHDFVYYEIVE